MTPEDGYPFREWGEYLWKEIKTFSIHFTDNEGKKKNLWNFPSKGNISAQRKQAGKRFLDCDGCEERYSSPLAQTSNDNPLRRDIVLSFLDGNELINPIDSFK